MPAASMGKCLAEPRPRQGHRSEPTAGAKSRAAAARVVHAVIGGGRSLNDALAEVRDLDDRRDRPLVQDLSFGTLRLLPRLQAVSRELLRKPLKPEDGDLSALILVGLYQLAATRIPPHAAVASSVEAVRLLGRAWAANLVNALLRRFQRERDVLLARADRSPESKWLFPRWLQRRLQRAWPDRWEELIQVSNGRAPMTLRVNRMFCSRLDYAARLTAAGIAARPAPWTPAGLVLDRPLPVDGLPGFREGHVSIQDAAAQLAAPLLGPRPGERILDACAAPGGKTAHLLELTDNRLHLTAIDSDVGRLHLIAETLDRLSLTARLAQGDATCPSGPWAAVPYDRILLDAPCSATGVIRRHPDIKWLRRDADIAALVFRQSEMLDALWPLVAAGGRLLYVTCSVLPEENERQVAAFLARQPEVREVPIEATWGIPRAVGRQILPSAGGSDGFYYAQLERRAT
jgi:16S rRNA (cytosine967-C5)-methyltransferase